MGRNHPRSPGRPAASERAGQEARQTLVDTAASLFAEQGFEGTSLKQVARGAGVTPAMVAYYFKDKSGLLEAVVREGLSTLLKVVESVVEDHTPGQFVPGLIGRYITTISRAPWIPQILIREVISKESPLRKLFIEEFAMHAATMVPARVAEEMQEGTLRRDLDPKFVILSLLGMCLFPFIAQPVLGPLLDFEVGEEFGDAYAAHVLELFTRGAGVAT